MNSLSSIECKHRCQNCTTQFVSEELHLFHCPECKALNFVPGHLGHYELYAFAGHGGGGHVYRAHSKESPGIEFAVKVLHDMNVTEEGFEAFRREAEIVTLFNDHPNCISSFDFGIDKDRFFYTMNYVEGDTLAEILQRDGLLDEVRVVEIMTELASIENAILKAGYLYRDLKPENVIITPNGNPVLVDFGLCEALENLEDFADDDEEEDVKGTAAYIPPERLTGEVESEVSEIYSMGMLMYHCLTGRTMYQGQAQEIAESHVQNWNTGEYVNALSDVSPQLRDLIRVMIRRNPDDRLSSMESVEAYLRELRDFYEL